MEERWGSNYLLFSYDEAGRPYAVNYNGTWYYYVLNLQGDVVRIVSDSGSIQAEYRYNAWGKVDVTAGADGLGNINPIRYRGYYYDVESGLYYQNSRYYDTEVGRFISADSYVSTGQDIIGHNMFGYCGNNPIVRIDVDGTKWKFAIKINLHLYNLIAVAIGVDTAAIGAIFLDMTKDSNGVYHADFECWQQYFGYNDFYDYMFATGSSMRAAKFSFKCNGKGYTIWAWKGDYINLGAGAELGIYRGNLGHRTVDKSLAMKMSMKLKYKGKTIINYSPLKRQWWITGFNPKYLNVLAYNLTATFTLQFKSSAMFKAFRSKYSLDTRWRFYTNGYRATFTF